ncbi:MAG: chemotaxis protein CheR, partial [Lachnospiraceae bacterium]|nr:chemotaxis protein CheR [Lachnospiraceae bacterium]
MMKDDEFFRIATYMKQNYGIDLGQKKVIMNGRLENYIKRGGWGSFHDFMDELQKDKTGKFDKELVN